MVSLTSRLRSGRRSSQRGAEIVELAIILPLLLLITAGIVDFGLLFRDYQIVTNAAREGARVRVLPGYSDDDAKNRATAYLAASGLTSNVDPTVAFTDVTPGGGGATFRVYTVTVAYDHTITMLGAMMQLVGGSLAGTLRVTGASTMRHEIEP